MEDGSAMRSEQIRALNYSAHAIDDLRRIEARIRDSWPSSSRAMRRVIDMLRDSVKFLLPNCAELIDPDELRQAHLDLLHLPFPLVAFEAPWETNDRLAQIGDFPQTPATKRIALCWEVRPEYEVVPGLNDILTRFPERGVFVLPIFWAPATGEWMVAMGGQIVPYGNTMTTGHVGERLPASEIAMKAMADSGRLGKAGKAFSAEPFCLLREPFELAIESYGSVEKAFAQVILDAGDEVQTLVQACSVLNCANVTTAELAAPEALNKKRRANDKQPFFSYKLLQLSEDRQVAKGSGISAGGGHASPRMHLRRGHLRRLEGRVIWVRPAMINAAATHGVVAKAYALNHGGARSSD